MFILIVFVLYITIYYTLTQILIQLQWLPQMIFKNVLKKSPQLISVKMFHLITFQYLHYNFFKKWESWITMLPEE